MVDVDGTLVGIYRNGTRSLRPFAVAALELLAARGPVFLWSLAGAENADRLLVEYPELARHVSGTFEKPELPTGVEAVYCIDDEESEEPPARAGCVIVDSYREGPDSGQQLLEAAKTIAAWIKEGPK